MRPKQRICPLDGMPCSKKCPDRYPDDPASGATANVHSPAGTSTETGQVRKPDGCKKCTHAKSAPVQIVHPNLPGLPEIVFSRSKQQPDPGQNGPGSK